MLAIKDSLKEVKEETTRLNRSTKKAETKLGGLLKELKEKKFVRTRGVLTTPDDNDKNPRK